MLKEQNELDIPKKQTSASQQTPVRLPEVLAPAGGRKQFFAALNSGADAVYLGLQNFNARKRAENFSIEDLEELVPLARLYGMRVLVTVNILIKEEELEDLIQFLARLEAVGPDAIIVQDLGVVRLVREFFPGLRLHASTQMAIHSLAGAKYAKRLGIRRVVLARELTLNEIKTITAKTADSELEIEVFCHGSLCYSYSGLCFFSGAADSRSGNRGECAYTCRVPYKIISEPGHGFLFSMRDLDSTASIDDLVKAGVHTLKIEGRKKDAHYVSSVVRLYRNQLAKYYGEDSLRSQAPEKSRELLIGSSEEGIRDDLAYSFQRRSTSFFLKSRYRENVIDLDNPTHIGKVAGEIAEVKASFGDMQGHLVKVTTQIPLSLYDGLKILPKASLYHSLPQDGRNVTKNSHELLERYENESNEFSLRSMRQRGKKISETPTGATVEILVPPNGPAPKKGDYVYKVRSNDLKNKVEGLSHPPQGVRLNNYRNIDLVVTLKKDVDKNISLVLGAMKQGNEFHTKSYKLNNPLNSMDNSKLEGNLAKIFTILGDARFRVERIDFKAKDDIVANINPSELKAIKRDFILDLDSKYTNLINEKCQKALESSKKNYQQLRATKEEAFSIKIDRLETLLNLQATLREEKGLLNIDEIVFEPKRAFLDIKKLDVLMEALEAFATDHGVAVRWAIPTVNRAWDEPLLAKVFKAVIARGFKKFELGNLAHFTYLSDWAPGEVSSFDLSSDFTLFTLNHMALEELRSHGIQKFGLSIEDDLQNLSLLMKNAPRQKVQVIVYKDTPLFIAEACSLTALHNGCPTSKVCGYRSLEIENPKGERFIVSHEGCKSIVYGKNAYSLSGNIDQLKKIGLSHFRIDFLVRSYTKSEIAEILCCISQDRLVAGTHSANFHRRLL